MLRFLLLVFISAGLSMICAQPTQLKCEDISNLSQLAANNQVNLMWVSGHTGIKAGNEEADCLAKEGANTPFPAQNVAVDSPKPLKEEFRRWEFDEMKSRWHKVPGQKQAKRLVSLSPRKAKQLLGLDKKDLKLETGLLTGHRPLGYQIFAETAEHLCKRLKFLGAFSTPPDIRNSAFTTPVQSTQASNLFV